jgi:P27 family predicted phage terminase small subunit
MPAPIPAKLLLLHGRGNGKDAAGYQVPLPPAFERTPPTAPAWLDDEGRDEWDRVVDDLVPLGLLKNSDRAVLAAHCEAWSRFVAAVRVYHEQGVVRINPDSGRVGKHAAVSVAENAAVQLAKLGGLLGLSPVAERGLGSFQPSPDADDPFVGQG